MTCADDFCNDIINCAANVNDKNVFQTYALNLLCQIATNTGGGGAVTENVNLAKIGGVSQSGANVVDVANTALRVNVVASSGGGAPSGTIGAAAPATVSPVAFSDGTNLQYARLFDLDTGAGTQYSQGVSIRISGSGGSIEAKGSQTSANSLPVVIASDQAALTITGTVAATQSGGWTVTANAGTNLNTSALLTTAAFQAAVNTLGQKVMASSTPVVIASDQSAIPISISGNQAVNLAQVAGVTTAVGNGVVGTGVQRVAIASDNTAFNVTANAGTNLNTSALALDATAAKLNVAQAAALGANTGPMVQGSVTTTAPTYTTGQVNPVSLTTTGGLRVDVSGSSPPADVTTTTNLTGAATGQTAVIALNGAAVVTAVRTATGSGFGSTAEASIDGGTNWFGIYGYQGSTGSITTTIPATSGDFVKFDVSGFSNFRIRCTAQTSGTTTVVLRASSAPMTFPFMKDDGTFGTQSGNSGSAPPVNIASYGGSALGTSQVGDASTGASTSCPRVVIAACAQGQADEQNPIKIGGQARTANPTAVTNGQRVSAIFDKLGKQICVGAVRDLKTKEHTTITSSTAETTVAAAGAASVFKDIYGIIVTNTSATACAVTFKDATGGTTQIVIEVPAGDTRGFTVGVDSAIPQTASANPWTATCGTSVASIEITMLGVLNL